jgi:hypothetical protein
MKRLALLFAGVLTTLAAGPCVAKAPAPFGVVAEVAGDTVRVSAAACQVSGSATVSCRVAVSGTVGTTAIAFPAVADLLPGQSVNVSAAIVCTDRAPIGVTVASRGVNADGVLSAPTAATGTAVCPAGLPGQPGTFTVTVTVTP